MNTVDKIMRQFTKAIDKLDKHSEHLGEKVKQNNHNIEIYKAQNKELEHEQTRAKNISDKLKGLMDG